MCGIYVLETQWWRDGQELYCSVILAAARLLPEQALDYCGRLVCCLVRRPLLRIVTAHLRASATAMRGEELAPHALGTPAHTGIAAASPIAPKALRTNCITHYGCTTCGHMVGHWHVGRWLLDPESCLLVCYLLCVTILTIVLLTILTPTVALAFSFRLISCARVRKAVSTEAPVCALSGRLAQGGCRKP